MNQAIHLASSRWFSIAAIALFFFNTAFFNGRISLVLLLTPLWIFLVWESKVKLRPFLVTGSILTLYACIHLIAGIPSMSDYLVSFAVLISILLFLPLFAQAVSLQEGLLDETFRNLLLVNAALTVVSLLLLWIPQWQGITWYVMSVSEGIEPIPRLKLFTPEASHYAFILAPLVIYFLTRSMMFTVRNQGFLLLLVLLPLLLSFSLGVIAALAISGLAIFIYGYRNWFSKKMTFRLVSLWVLTGVALLAALWFLYPENPLFLRLENLAQGEDTSGRGRTYEAFILADMIVQRFSAWFGIGPGQLKLAGRDIIIQYYYYTDIPSVIRIPNAAAETIVWFGYTGLAIRLALEAVLFKITKVWSNPFRLWLFIFLFIYQFTGSYITNVNEYMLWTLAFIPVFKDLEVKT